MGSSGTKSSLMQSNSNKKYFCSSKNEIPLGSFFELQNGNIAVGAISGSIMIFEFQNNKFSLCFIHEKAHDSGVVAFTETPNQILISGSQDKTIKLWEQSFKSLTLIKTLTHHTQIVSRLITLNTFDRFLSCSIDGTLKIYESASPFNVVKTLYEENSLMYAIQLSKEHVNKVVCTGAKFSDGSKPFISIWNVETFEQEHMFQGNEEFMPIFLLELPNGNVVISTKYAVYVVNPMTFQRVAEIRDSNWDDMPVGICMFQDEYIVVSCSGYLTKVRLQDYKIVYTTRKAFQEKSTIINLKFGDYVLVNKGHGLYIIGDLSEV